jgi:hypothetical protein
MIRHNPENKRIKHAYLDFLREAIGRDPAALDAVAMALHRFETFTGYLNFRTFDRDQAGEFKVYLASLSSAHGGSASPHSSLHRTRLFARERLRGKKLENSSRSPFDLMVGRADHASWLRDLDSNHD